MVFTKSNLFYILIIVAVTNTDITLFGFDTLTNSTLQLGEMKISHLNVWNFNWQRSAFGQTDNVGEKSTTNNTITGIIQNQDMMDKTSFTKENRTDIHSMMVNDMTNTNNDSSQGESMDLSTSMVNMTMSQMPFTNQTSLTMAEAISPFNPTSPIVMPLVEGYYNGAKVYFIHTEVSDKDMAKMMTTMINFPTLYVPSLANTSEISLSKVYIFTNGIPGPAPYGGGPFMFQIDVFDSIPQMKGYSNFKAPSLVTWNDNATARVLTSVDEIIKAKESGELIIEESDDMIINAPVIAWIDENGQIQSVSSIDRVFESMPDFDGQVTHVDIDNYIMRLNLYLEK